MQNFLEQLNTAKKSVSLNPEVKSDLRSQLVQFMAATAAIRPARRSFFANPFAYFKTAPVLAVIAILVLIGGGTSFAAEGALPGDILYPIKININEEVRATLAITAQAKADWSVTRAERRLDEASILASEGKLNDVAKAQVENNFNIEADKAETQIADLRAKGDVQAAANVNSRFEGALRTRVQVLGKLRADKKGEDKNIQPLEDHAGNVLNSVVQANTKLEADIRATSTSEDNNARTKFKSAAIGELDAAANIVSSTRKHVELEKDKLGADATAQAETKLQTAADTIVQGQAKIQAGLYGEAFNLGNQAIRTAQEVRLSADANLKLNLRLRLDATSTDRESDSENSRVRNNLNIHLDASSSEKYNPGDF